MDCSPAALARASRCWCLPDNAQRAAKIYALRAWANAGGAAPAPPPCTLPTAPVDLGASAGDGQVTLTWPAGVGATGYNIKRALVTGGPYTVIGTSAASPYVDHTAVNGTEYFYVVSSTNACGESAGNSIESHATPVAPGGDAYDNMESYTVTNGVNGLNGGTGWLGLYVDRSNLDHGMYDDMESYTVGDNVNGLNGASTGSCPWGGAYVDR